MKKLALSRLAFAAMLFFFCVSFEPAKAPSHQKSDNTYYYWYLDNGTVYDGYRNTSDEIARLENLYGLYIDTDPLDGSLIASGYFLRGYPHLVYASVFLYSH